MISITGKLNKINPISINKGFTLLELLVVISIISILLFIATPRFYSVLFIDDFKQASRKIISQIKFLKQASFNNQKMYVLNFNIDLNKVWVTDSLMQIPNKDKSFIDEYKLPDSVDIVDIEFPIQGKIASGHAMINFYKQAYSDKAFVHLKREDDNEYLSFLIEPFLYKVKIYEGYQTFNE